jgi:ribokinase
MAPQLLSVIGCLHTDHIMLVKEIPAQGESMGAKQYYEALGGKGANSAIAAYRASHTRPPDGVVSEEQRVDESDENEIEVCMIGAVGDDESGQKLTDELQRNGVDVSGVRQVAGKKSGISFVLVEAKTGENRCTFSNNANDSLTVDDFGDVEGLGNGRQPDLIITQMELDRAVVEKLIETAGEAEIDLLLNAAPANALLRRLYPYVTHLLVNEQEAATMSGEEEVTKDTWEEIADYFLDCGAKNVVLTLGAGGAYFAGSDDRGHVPACKVDVVDCTGAG